MVLLARWKKIIMRVVYVDKDMVFYYLKDDESVYAFDTDNNTCCNLRFESVYQIHLILINDKHVFFMIREDD